MRFRTFFRLTLSLLLLAGCSRPAENAIEEETQPVTVETATSLVDAASISGLVKLEGAIAPSTPVQMSGDPACELHGRSSIPAVDVVRGAGGELANVFVYIKDFSGNFAAPKAPVLLDQKDCMYAPHVTGLQVGQVLQIRNSDPTLHNVHAMGKVNEAFNEGQPVKGMVDEKTFEKPEVMIRFKCDVHSWMNSYVGVLPHPFFSVTAPNGAFSIQNLPPGTYTLEAWHEKFGTQTQKITVGPKESRQINFTFKV